MRILQCRGPESHGSSGTTGAAAGHRRLEIIGLGSPGSQPYTQDESRDVLLFNGELYNYGEIAAELNFSAKSDTHVLYRLLKSRDWRRLGRLRGMYAFVFFDAARQEILTGRDPFGIKPLYMLRHPDGNLSFASVAGALARFPGAKQPDPVAIAGFLSAGYFPAGSSAFRNISKLPPGEIRTWSREGGSWIHSSRVLDFSAWDELEISDALEDSVGAHLVADVPVGVLLSGGVDSTLLAALARTKVADLRSFSLTNPDTPDIDESGLAAWNARLLGTIHTEVPVRPVDLASRMETLIQSTGEPFADAAYLPLSILCQRVSEDLKVVLAGEGADELFGGYKRYEVEAFQAGWLGQGAKLASKALAGSRLYERRAGTQRVRALAALGAGPGLKAHGYLMGAEWDVVRRSLPAATAQAWWMAQERWNALEDDPLFHGMPANRAFDTREWLSNVFLEKSDRASMLHSLEVRVPFLDPAVAVAAAKYVPSDTLKRPLRLELERLVPGVRLPATKKGLSVATREIVEVPSINAIVDQELGSSDGVLGIIGMIDSRPLRSRCQKSANLSFRIAALGIWGSMWLR